MTEAELLKRLMLGLSMPGTRVFRNHVGLAYQGEPIRFSTHGRIEVFPGDVLVRQARQVQAGLCVGSSDLIGWHSVVVTPDMVGRTVAVFSGFEAKSKTGRLTVEQQRFLDAVRAAGGIGVEARDVDGALSALKEQERGRA
jgi:hypothetical protein